MEIHIFKIDAEQQIAINFDKIFKVEYNNGKIELVLFTDSGLVVEVYEGALAKTIWNAIVGVKTARYIASGVMVRE